MISRGVKRVWGLDLHGWEQLMLVSLGFAALAAVFVTVTTGAVIRLQKQEAAQANSELERYKAEAAAEVGKAHERIAELSTQGEALKRSTAEANARASEANLSLQRLKMPRMLDPEPLKVGLAGVRPPSIIDILYVEECSDCFMLASMLHAVLNDMHWPVSAAPIRRLQSGPDWLLGLPAVLQHRANPMGISLVSRTAGEIDDGSTQSAVVRALMKAVSGTNGQWSGDETMPDDAIKIVVAPKV